MRCGMSIGLAKRRNDGRTYLDMVPAMLDSHDVLPGAWRLALRPLRNGIPRMTTIVFVLPRERLEMQVDETVGAIRRGVQMGRRYAHPCMTNGERTGAQRVKGNGRDWIELEVKG